MNESIGTDIDGNDENNIELLPYYVYELRDPRTTEVFYVGKGTKDRVYVHSEEEENAKGARIREIKNSGYTELRLIIGRFRTEEEAFAVETVSIKWHYGFDNLTNKVHGHRHRFIRPFQQKTSGTYLEIPGIDVPRKIVVGRDGSYTNKLRQQISESQVLEKLESLRDDLRLRVEFINLLISEPDLSTPSDPCIIVSGFQPSSVQLQIKMQLTGSTVVLNLVPTDRRRLAEFEATLTSIKQPFDVKNGNSRFGGKYAPANDFKSAEGGFPRGIAQDDIDSIVQIFLKTISRLHRYTNTE